MDFIIDTEIAFAIGMKTVNKQRCYFVIWVDNEKETIEVMQVLPVTTNLNLVPSSLLVINSQEQLTHLTALYILSQSKYHALLTVFPEIEID